MKDKKIAIVGLGYVGLPLALAFSKKFKIVAYDNDSERVKSLNEGHDWTFEIDDSILKAPKNITFTNNTEKIASCNIFIVTVPTPVDKSFKPDLTPLRNVSKSIGLILKKDDIVIYESTVYPGVTEEVCVPILEEFSDLKFNKDFYCGYSPERINPGDKNHTVDKILKVTSGSTPEIAIIVNELYEKVIEAGTFLASSIKVAEASKVIENIQRDVNIALINELAMIFSELNIDTNEVLDAADTKWNFNKFTPGLVGGHCIGVDPYYLSFKAQEVGQSPDLILTARKINNGMSDFIATRTEREMNKHGKIIKNSNILVLGATFKEDCPDIRNSQVIHLILNLEAKGAKIDLYDPWLKKNTEKNLMWSKFLIGNPLKLNHLYDAIIVAVSHKEFKAYSSDDFLNLSNGELIIIDIKNIVEKPSWRL